MDRQDAHSLLPMVKRMLHHRHIMVACCQGLSRFHGCTCYRFRRPHLLLRNIGINLISIFGNQKMIPHSGKFIFQMVHFVTFPDFRPGLSMNPLSPVILPQFLLIGVNKALGRLNPILILIHGLQRIPVTAQRSL